MTQTPRDWQEDMEWVQRRADADEYEGWTEPLLYWLREAKERGRRERHLKETLEHCIKEYPLYDSKEIGGSLMIDFMKNILSTFYPDTQCVVQDERNPDTPAPKEGRQ